MKIERLTEIETKDIQIGDRIRVSHYTTTCQKITQQGALFLFDQCLDRPMPMIDRSTNLCGYEESDLRKELQSDEVLDIFKGIRDYMVPFDNGDLIRIPFAGEIFENYDVPDYCEPDGHEQWPLMQDVHNQTASRCGKYAWNWLQNRDMHTSTNFIVVTGGGFVEDWNASVAVGVRPVFMVKEEERWQQ